tara:strand:+ start:3168 stop:3362 length:195 start_codon:yes stop_codon:yes gene_type:complete
LNSNQLSAFSSQPSAQKVSASIQNSKALSRRACPKAGGFYAAQQSKRNKNCIETRFTAHSSLLT